MNDEIESDPTQSVAVAYVHQDEVHYSWHHSMTQMLAYDGANNGRIWQGGYVAIRGGTDGLAHARNTAVQEFLNDSSAHWLWWIDTDMGFMPDTVDQLFAAADPVERPVVGALCFANREVENDGMGGRRSVAAPVIMRWAHDGDEAGFDTRWDYPANTLVRCEGVGAACVLIHRSVFEKVAETFGPNWYTRARNPSTGQMISEDLSLCVRMMALEIPVHVHTGVSTTHAKRIWLAEEDYWRQRALNPPPVTVEQRDTGQAAHAAARDWTVPRYAVIPTHNRPQLLTALVASLGPQCDRIVVLDNASEPPVDEEKLQAAAGISVTVLRDEEQPPHLSRFWNVMLDDVAEKARRAGHEVYDVAVFNDDAIVPAGWYDGCANGLREHDTAVAAHTTPTTPALLTELHLDPSNRMTPHAFVVRGEVGLRADESMRWWYFDDDLSWQARLTGGVLSVSGPRVVNARANTTTVGPLAEQAEKDRAVFEAKWSR